jgi:hypothetical protein
LTTLVVAGLGPDELSITAAANNDEVFGTPIARRRSVSRLSQLLVRCHKSQENRADQLGVCS